MTWVERHTTESRKGLSLNKYLSYSCPALFLTMHYCRIWLKVNNAVVLSGDHRLSKCDYRSEISGQFWDCAGLRRALHLEKKMFGKNSLNTCIFMKNKPIFHILWRKDKVHNYYVYLNVSWKLKTAILHLTWFLIFIPLSTFLSCHLTKSSWFFLPPLELLHLKFVRAQDFATEKMIICTSYVPYYANLSPLTHLLLVTVLPS